MCRISWSTMRTAGAAAGTLLLLLGVPAAGQAANTTTSTVAPQTGNDRNCIVNTGGSCLTENCYAFRGPTKCDTGRCFCTEGCAGADEICHPGEKNVQIVPDQVYTIRNARWPDYYMYARTDGPMIAKQDHDTDQSRFTVVVPPQTNWKDPIFLVFSEKWRDGAVVISESQVCSRRLSAEEAAAEAEGEVQEEVLPSDEVSEGRRLACQTVYGVSCAYVQGKLAGLGGDPPISQVGLKFTLAPADRQVMPNRTLVMLSSVLYEQRYLYIPSVGVTLGGWTVSVNRYDPGAGGYWFFDPPLPKEVMQVLPQYSGTRCSYACGDVAGGPRNQLAGAALLAVILAAVLW